MPITMQWVDDEHTILMSKFDGTWMLDQHAETAAKARSLVLEAGHPVYYIIDISTSGPPPIGIVANVLRATEHGIPDEVMSIIVGSQERPLIKALFDSAFKLFPQLRKQYRFAVSVDAACKLIRQSQAAQAAEQSTQLT